MVDPHAEPMTMERAIRCIGINATRHATNNMATALSICSAMNTTEEAERLKCAEYVLANWSAYQTEANRRRDERFRWVG